MKVSNKALVGLVGTLAVLGAVAITNAGSCLWALILVILLVEEVNG